MRQACQIPLRQDISDKYLEQIISRLSKAGLVVSARGAQGGYKLAKEPEACTVGEILRITEGSLAPVACLEHDPVECARAADCITLGFWRGLYDVVNQYVDSVTLEELVNQDKTLNYSI